MARTVITATFYNSEGGVLDFVSSEDKPTIIDKITEWMGIIDNEDEIKFAVEDFND